MINKIYLKYKELINYLIFGVLTTIINIVIYYIFSLFFHYTVANIVAFVLSVLFAFFTNKYFVFNSNEKDFLYKEIISFFSFRIISLIVDMVLMIIFIDLLNINGLLSKIIVNVVVVIINYLFSKLFIFNKGEYKNESKK